MTSSDRIIPCSYSLVENEKRTQVECCALEWDDCYELFVNQLPGNTPWPVRTLRMPKSLFRLVSEPCATSTLQLLITLDLDQVELPREEPIPGEITPKDGEREAPPRVSVLHRTSWCLTYGDDATEGVDPAQNAGPFTPSSAPPWAEVGMGRS